MNDPRIIALSSNPGQVEPGPLSEHELREQWNAQADEFNQWESLDPAEQLAWAQARAIASVQFPRLARLMQEPTAFELGELPPASTQPAGQAPAGPSLEEVGPLIAWLTEAATQSASAKAAGMLTWAAQVIGERVDEDAPDADQVEGPSLADVAELCEEFEFHLEGDGLEILQEMITAAITRWPAPVAKPAAQPVNLAELHDPDFSGGLTPSQHLDVLRGGPDPRLPPRVGHILRLAEIIREVDGKHELCAAALAEAILAHPGFSGCHDGPVASTVSPAEPSPVAISEAQNIGEDELYTNWYRCPKCNDDMITRGSNFWLKCGVKLQWEGGVTHA
jgi:hypothetical protein